MKGIRMFFLASAVLAGGIDAGAQVLLQGEQAPQGAIIYSLPSTTIGLKVTANHESFVAGFIGEPPMNFIKGTVKGGKIPFGKNSLDVAKKLGGKASKYEGKKIVFGFRPEAIELGAQPNAYQITADVELTEMLGDNTNVYITSGADKAILKVDPHDTPETDASIVFSIPEKEVYLFDGETEMVIK